MNNEMNKNTITETNSKPSPTKTIRLLCAALTVILFAALAVTTTRFEWNPASGTIVETLTDFTYETADGRSDAATFPHSIDNLAPNTAVTVRAAVEPGRYERLMVKTVYTGLKLYADGVLIYECGQPGSYPEWLLDPPTLLKSVPLPAGASQLRFEYISPSQRSAISLPVITAGSADAVLSELFHRNAALLIISFLLAFGGLILLVISFAFRRLFMAEKPFMSLGLLSLATGCWGLGECNATAFIIPYPAFLYLMAIGGLAALVIPLLSYGLTLIRPRNPKPLRIMRGVLYINLTVSLSLQFFGVKSLSASLLIIQILDILGLLTFAAVSVWESARHKNTTARQFILPSFILFAASVSEYVNYSLRFTNMLSLFYMTGTLIFIFILGVIGAHHTRALISDAENAKRDKQAAAAENAALSERNALLDRLNQSKTEFLQDMNHELRTPLSTIVMGITYADKQIRENGNLSMARETLEIAHDETLRIGRMLDGMAKTSAMSETVENRQRLNLAELLRASAEAFRLRFEKNNTELRFDIEEELPDVFVERDKFARVAANLLANALEHTNGGSVAISAELTSPFITVRISDAGEGIAPDVLPRIFERGASGGDGTGYGLYICKSIIEAHGGGISAENIAGGGAAVTFTVPVYGGQEVGHGK